MTSIILILVQQVRHVFDWLIMTRIGTSENDIDPDCVFVDVLHGLLGIEPILAFDGDRDKSTLDFEVTSELLECNLGIGTHDNIGPRLVN